MAAGEQLALGGWVQDRPDEPEPDYREEREELERLLDLGKTHLATISQRVALVLRKYPESRDSIVALVLTYWHYWNAEVLVDHRHEGLEVLYFVDNFESISRACRHIQNDLKLYSPSDFVKGLREDRQQEIVQYVVAQKHGAPEVRFYMDETGNNSKDPYVGVGGVCVVDWRLFELEHAALRSRRESLGPATLHCGDMGNSESELERHLALLAEVRRRRAGLLFMAHCTRVRVPKREILLSLFVQLVVDGLRHLEGLGCLTEARVVTLVKESEPGMDSLHLTDLQQSIQHAAARAFGDRVYVNPVLPVTKGREVMLECADQIAWGVFRRATSGGRFCKDKLAETVMNVTGLEDPEDSGAVFKYHPGA